VRETSAIVRDTLDDEASLPVVVSHDSAIPWNDLYTRTQSLNSMRPGTGSHAVDQRFSDMVARVAEGQTASDQQNSEHSVAEHAVDECGSPASTALQ